VLVFVLVADTIANFLLFVPVYDPDSRRAAALYGIIR
jgi:hypothetical protein